MEKMNNQKKTAALKALYEYLSSGENDDAFLDSPYCEVIVCGYEKDFVSYMKELGLSENEVCRLWIRFMLKSMDWAAASYALAPHDVLEHPLRPYARQLPEQYLTDTACALIHVLRHDSAQAAVIENRLRYAADYGMYSAKVLYMFAYCVNENVFLKDYVTDVLNRECGIDLLDSLLDQLSKPQPEKMMPAYPAFLSETKSEQLWHMLSRNGVCARRMFRLKEAFALTDEELLDVMKYEIAVFTVRFTDRSFKEMMEQLRKYPDRKLNLYELKTQIRTFHIERFAENGGFEDDNELPFQ